MAVKLIVFDLDETLPHATEMALSDRHDFRVEPYLIYVRRLQLR